MGTQFIIFSLIIILFLSISINVFLINKGSENNNYNKEEDFAENKYQKYEDEEEKEYFYDLSLVNQRDNQNRLKKNIMDFFDSSDFIWTINNNEIKKKIDIWKNNTYPYLGIERFSIPIISTISAGKSSTLNYILNLKYNLLQIGENITTKFCLIIRDNKNYKKGKIFNVTIEKRAEVEKFNFIKKDEIKEDPKIFLAKRNKYIENLEIDKEKDAGLYFVILEIDTGLFEGEFEKYSNLIEFIDLPGLNEKGLAENFYFRNILPFIKPNLLFPIIILDAKKFYTSDVFDIFNEIFKPYIPKNMVGNNYDLENQNFYLKKCKNNSLFLINKLNLFQEDERAEMIYKITNETSYALNVNLFLEKNTFQINSKAKNLEINKYESFLDYINYALNKEDLKESDEIKNIINKEIKKDFNYFEPSNVNEKVKGYKYSDSENEYNKFKKIIDDKKCRQGRFNKNYYYYFKSIFNSLKQKQKKLSFDNDGLKIKNVLKSKIKNSMDNFLNEEPLKEILNVIKVTEDELEKEHLSRVNLNKNTENPFEIIKILNEPIKKLDKLGNGNEGIKDLSKHYDDLIAFIGNNQFLHYLFSGPYSSGKSFTLNNLIGYNYYLLETGSAETTNHAFIIRYSKEINLYKGIIRDNKYQKFFEKGEHLANGKDSVKGKIRELNHKVDKFSIYILETPIEIFDDLRIKDDIKKQIEFIDFPGLDTTKSKKYIGNDVLKIINAFFFLNEPKDSGVHGVDEVFKTVMRELTLKDSNVHSLKNCLILFTKNNKEEQKDFYKKDYIKKVIDNLIQSLKNDLELVEIEKIKRKLNNTSMNFVKFSNIDYKNYIVLRETLTSFKTYINYIISTIKGNNNNIDSLLEDINIFINEKFNLEEKQKNSFFSFSWFSNKEQKNEKNYNQELLNSHNYIQDFIDILNENNLKGKNFIVGEKEKNIIIEYYKNYLNIKENLKNLSDYKNSLYEEFKLKFIELMENAQDSLNNIFIKYLEDILMKTHSVVYTINAKFEMNKEKFEKKYSEDENTRYLNRINDLYQIKYSEIYSKLRT